MPSLNLLAGIESLGIPRVSPTTLIVIGVLVWIFWPKISVFLKQAQANLATQPVSQPAQNQVIANALEVPSVNIKAVKNLVAERDRLNAAVQSAMSELKEIIDKETAPKA